jgi:hypothetical protein
LKLDRGSLFNNIKQAKTWRVNAFRRGCLLNGVTEKLKLKGLRNSAFIHQAEMRVYSVPNV